MELRINAGGDEQSLEQFYHWLRSDVDVVRSASVSAAEPAGAGHMGAFEVICMSFGSLTGLANLGIAWASFLRNKKEKPPFTINVVGVLSDEELELVRKMRLPLKPEAPGGDA